MVRKWFQRGTMCAGLDLKDAFRHVPMHAKVKKFLRFKWKGKLYEWQVLPFGIKCSLRILTFMVRLIVRFLHGRGISFVAFWDDFTNQAICRCKALFQLDRTQSCLIPIIRVRKSWRSCSIPHRQHDGNSLHKETGGTRSQALCKESHQLWQEAIDRNITILPPQWLASKANAEADFLSRHSLLKWDFKLISSEFWRVCHKLQVWPTLDAFACRGTHQIAKYMT